MKTNYLLSLSAILALMPVTAENLISTRFSADPSVHFFNNKFYVYATNDQDNSGTYWDSTDWRLFSSADLKSWQDEGSFLDISVFSWAGKTAKAWAPGAIERNGKFYFFAPVGGKQIGVAVSDKPNSGFKDPLGKPLVETPRDQNAGAEPIDPMVFVDKDGQSYLYFGTRIPKVVKLKQNMLDLDGQIQDIIIEGFPETDKKKKYGEAPYLHEHNGVYYFTFSTGWPGQIVYATGNNPMGPFTYRGVVFDYLPISTNHQAIIEKDGKTYFFYHDGSLDGGGDHKRAIRFAELHYEKDGSIVQVKVPTPSLNIK
jgi:beta-xylosidase